MEFIQLSYKSKLINVDYKMTGFNGLNNRLNKRLFFSLLFCVYHIINTYVEQNQNVGGKYENAKYASTKTTTKRMVYCKILCL